MPSHQTIENGEARTHHGNVAPVTELAVDGMTCGNCARHVTEALQSVKGVRSATVTLDAGQASVRWETGSDQNTDGLIRAVEKAGYSAKALEKHDHAAHASKNWQMTLWIALLSTVILMFGEWVLQLGTTPWFRWFSFAVATLVQ